jgi:hypothetical protein
MGEFAETLMRMRRDDNPLSTTLRSAWDGHTLRTRTKKDPMIASDAHVSVIGHITEADLRAHLGRSEVFNGFGNRFLWVLARRSKELPFGGSVTISDPPEIVAEVTHAIQWAHERPRNIAFDGRVRSLWPELYGELSHAEGGPFGAITDRAVAQVRRLALIYAAVDRSSRVARPHLDAAVEVWRYCEQSAAYLWADAPASPAESTVLRLLRERRGWMSRSRISKRGFKSELKAYLLTSALSGLCERGLIEERRIKTKGRPRTDYRATGL